MLNVSRSDAGVGGRGFKHWLISNRTRVCEFPSPDAPPPTFTQLDPHPHPTPTTHQSRLQPDQGQLKDMIPAGHKIYERFTPVCPPVYREQ